jgi:hypothetical protein
MNLRVRSVTGWSDILIDGEDLSIQNCLRLILETSVGRSWSFECRCQWSREMLKFSILRYASLDE